MKKALFAMVITALFLNMTTIGLSLSATTNSDPDSIALETSEKLNLKKGDIVFRYVDEELYPMFRWLMHPMIYTGETDGIYYTFIEANGKFDICYTTKSKESILRSNDPALYTYLYRAKHATPQEIDNVIAFAEWRRDMGDKFLEVYSRPSKNCNPEEDSTWYCTEFVWAAYMNCKNDYSLRRYGEGIDIDSNEGQIVSPSDIQNSTNLEKVSLIDRDSTNKIKNPYLSARCILNRVFLSFITEIRSFNLKTDIFSL
jgi:hypothetical protein